MMDNIRKELARLLVDAWEYAEEVCAKKVCRTCPKAEDPADECLTSLAVDYFIDHGVTVQEWIPVTERLPEIVTTKRAWRNVYHKSDRVLCACLQKSGKQMVKEGYMEFFNDYPEPIWRITGTIDSVTHWMSLPTLPKGDSV